MTRERVEVGVSERKVKMKPIDHKRRDSNPAIIRRDSNTGGL